MLYIFDLPIQSIDMLFLLNMFYLYALCIDIDFFVEVTSTILHYVLKRWLLLYVFDLPIQYLLTCYFVKCLTCVHYVLTKWFQWCPSYFTGKNKHDIHKSSSNDLKLIRHDHNYTAYRVLLIACSLKYICNMYNSWFLIYQIMFQTVLLN